MQAPQLSRQKSKTHPLPNTSRRLASNIGTFRVHIEDILKRGETAAP